MWSQKPHLPSPQPLPSIGYLLTGVDIGPPSDFATSIPGLSPPGPMGGTQTETGGYSGGPCAILGQLWGPDHKRLLRSYQDRQQVIGKEPALVARLPPEPPPHILQGSQASCFSGLGLSRHSGTPYSYTTWHPGLLRLLTAPVMDKDTAFLEFQGPAKEKVDKGFPS